MDINDTFYSLNVGLPEDILRRKLHGDFEGAIRLIDARLQREDIPQPLRACMTAQREMMLRTPPDYPFTRAQALELVRRYIPDFSGEEFDRRVDAGGIGWIYMNGEMRFFARFFETLCKVDAAFARRAGQVPAERAPMDRCIRQMKERGSQSLRIRIRSSLRLKEGSFVPGMFLRAHLPIPAACEQQRDIVIEEMYPGGQIAPEDAEQRTVCWEGNFETNPEFFVVYSYTHTARYRDLSAGQVEGPEPGKEFLLEQPPHILFTPYIRDLAASLTEGVEDPLEKARRFYNFITLNMKYTFMPAYFGLENIAENCARNFTGDCGVFALLFITLCRCAGIPAAWQSGLVAEPSFCSGHDWTRFYVPGHGWLFADPSYGIAAVRQNNEERRQFYFGSLDPYRMVANRAFQAGFTVEKEHWRADPYDNQVGELETAEQGLRYEDFERTKEVLLCEEV